MYGLNLPWCIYVPFPHVLSLVTRQKRLVLPSPLPLLKNVKTAVRLPSFLQARQPKCPQPPFI